MTTEQKPEAKDERTEALAVVLRALRNPLVLMSVPDRRDVVALCARFDITAAELVELATKRAKQA